MFTGWFKIEGHSNPKHRKGFGKSSEHLRNKKRLGKGLLEPHDNRRAGTFSRSSKLNILWHEMAQGELLLSVIMGLGTILLFAQRTIWGKGEVAKRIEQRYFDETGEKEMISPLKKHLREAENAYEAGNYQQAYRSYSEAYKYGALDRKIIIGLWQSSYKLCSLKQAHCDDARKWKELIDRVAP